MKKESKIDDNILEIILGSLLISGNEFNGGILIEKIIVLLGLLIFLIGVVRTIVKYRGQNKKVMMIFLILTGILLTVAFLGLLYRLIFA